MKIIVERYNNNQNINSNYSKTAPQINNPTVLSIIDNAITRNNHHFNNSTQSGLSTSYKREHHNK